MSNSIHYLWLCTQGKEERRKSLSKSLSKEQVRGESKERAKDKDGHRHR